MTEKHEWAEELSVSAAYARGLADGRAESGREAIEAAMRAEIAVIKEAFREVLTISDRNHEAWSRGWVLLNGAKSARFFCSLSERCD